MRWKILIIGLLIVTSLKAQIFVKSGGRGDGSSWENATGNIREALNQKNDVRVAIGTYKLDEELYIQAGQTISGGWNPSTGKQAGNDAEMTILLAAENCRVAKVAGTMRGFTVSGGYVMKKNGGGLYITSTGVVERCVIRENNVAAYYLKVGDLLCTDGSFLPSEELTKENVERVCGIVFWINPDPNAPALSRGWVMGFEWTLERWSSNASSSNKITGESCGIIEKALADIYGQEHLNVAKASGNIKDYPALAYCSNLNTGGRGWYLPAFGQLKTLFSEYGKIKEMLSKIKEHKPTFGLTFADLGYASSSEETKKNNSVWIVRLENSGDIVCSGYVSEEFRQKLLVLPITSF